MKLKNNVYIAISIFLGFILTGCFDQLDMSGSGDRVSYPILRDSNVTSVVSLAVQGTVILPDEHPIDDLSGIRVILGLEGSASACSENEGVQTTVTDADGNYNFENIHAGSYALCAEVSLNDGTVLAKVLSRISVDPKILNDTLNVGEVTLAGVIQQRLTFDIFVVDADTRAPISYAALAIKPIAVEPTANGVFFPGETVLFDANGYYGSSQYVTVFGSEEFNPYGANNIGVHVFTHVVSKEGYNTVVMELSNDDLKSQIITLVIALEKTMPMQVGVDTDWSSVQATSYHMAALKQDGSLYTWGNYTFAGMIEGEGNLYSTTPQMLGWPGEWRSIVSLGPYLNFGITKVGRLMAWFDGADSPDLLASGKWKSFDGGSNRGIGDDGSLWGWGESGSTGANFSLKRIGDDVDWESVNGGVALKEDNSLWSLAHLCEIKSISKYKEHPHPYRLSDDNDWQAVDLIGIGVRPLSVVVALKLDGSLWACGQRTMEDDMVEELVRIGSANDWIQISASQGGSLLIKGDGTLWRWDGDIYSEPTQVGVDSNWAVAAASPRFGAAIKTDGTLWSWGNDWWDKL